jgi:peroxiredoxin Q/BCP
VPSSCSISWSLEAAPHGVILCPRSAADASGTPPRAQGFADPGSDTRQETQMSDMAPDFTLPGTAGDVTLSDLRGKAVVLFFYPRDDTSGCTKENEAFSAMQDDFTAAGAVVYGISKDSIASHEKFMAKKDLTVQLLSDETSDVCEKFGVWKEKSMYGKKFMGIERSTFLIDAEGRIAREWRKVKVPGHAEEVLEAVRAL